MSKNDEDLIDISYKGRTYDMSKKDPVVKSYGSIYKGCTFLDVHKIERLMLISCVFDNCTFRGKSLFMEINNQTIFINCNFPPDTHVLITEDARHASNYIYGLMGKVKSINLHNTLTYHNEEYLKIMSYAVKNTGTVLQVWKSIIDRSTEKNKVTIYTWIPSKATYFFVEYVAPILHEPGFEWEVHYTRDVGTGSLRDVHIIESI